MGEWSGEAAAGGSGLVRAEAGKGGVGVGVDFGAALG